ncbi:MAG: hypothetical protein COS68_01690 [Elusimicrobia bacterium CG06_land_8_20_14_3_00_38_11]|nr:MAG: hypothetical protein COS68_01690 [Elusimicrobia bacterium CG06_land_8_20_14_3_00_38_11]
MDSLVIVSFAVSILLAVYELSGVLKARLSGRTKNTGRVIARFFILVMLMVLLGESVHWYAYISAIELPLAEDIRIRNTPFLICILGLTTIIIFIFVEMWTLFAEKKKGIAVNFAYRLISAAIILLCLIPILRKTVTMWDTYNEKLLQQYEYIKKR